MIDETGYDDSCEPRIETCGNCGCRFDASYTDETWCADCIIIRPATVDVR